MNQEEYQKIIPGIVKAIPDDKKIHMLFTYLCVNDEKFLGHVLTFIEVINELESYRQERTATDV